MIISPIMALADLFLVKDKAFPLSNRMRINCFMLGILILMQSISNSKQSLATANSIKLKSGLSDASATVNYNFYGLRVITKITGINDIHYNWDTAAFQKLKRHQLSDGRRARNGFH